MQGRHTFQDRKVLKFCLSEHLPRPNLYDRLRQVLQLDYLYQATKPYYGSFGQKSIDPVVFFKLCLIQHLENIDSDRRLMEVCSLRLDIRYFLGYNLGEELPYHSTLCRTRKLLPRHVFEKLFTQIHSLCVVAGSVAAVDSALVKANASMDSLELKLPEEKLEEALQKARPVMSTARRRAKKNNASLQQQSLTASKEALQQIESSTRKKSTAGVCFQLIKRC